MIKTTSSVLVALMAITTTAVWAANSVPFSAKLPGWKYGTLGAPVNIRAFYDLT